MFGLDDWIAHFSDGATLLDRDRRRRPPRPASRDRPGPPGRGDDADRVGQGADEARRGAARLRLGPRPRDDAVRVRPADRALQGLPARARAAGRRDGDRLRDRRARGLAARALAPGRLPRPRARPRHEPPRPRARSLAGDEHAHRHSVRARSPLQAYGIGLVHGMGGSAGVGVLLLAAIHDRVVAVLALALFAFFTAVSMALLSTGFGLTLSQRAGPAIVQPDRPRARSDEPASSASGTRSARSQVAPYVF